MSTRIEQLHSQQRHRIHVTTDRGFLVLLIAQWILATVLALWISPYTYDGEIRHVHMHVLLAVAFGGVINALPIFLIITRSGWSGTRHTIAAVQMLWSGLLIMITGGRIETHFHVFGSLAFLALYRDWRVLLTASACVVVDHVARGLWWPDSVYGTDNPEWWRFLEHAAWVVFEDIVLAFACVRQTRDMRAAAAHEAGLEEERKREQENMERYRALVESTAAIPFEWDRLHQCMRYVAPRLGDLLGFPVERARESGFLNRRIHQDDARRVADATEQFVKGLRPPNEALDVRFLTMTGEERNLRVFQSVASENGQIISGVMLDITRQCKLERELQQAQKLESVGRLAAGVAHEINTPVQFVGDSIEFVRETVNDLFEAYETHRACSERVLAGDPDRELAVTAAAKDAELDYAYLRTEYPHALDRALEGTRRVSSIVRSLKVFAHPGRESSSTADLNAAVDTALTIARNEYRYCADVTTHYGELPTIRCHINELNQAILNIIINASHAISERVGNSGQRGNITVETRHEAGGVCLSISDTGGGIPEAIRDRIFDPYFTTKDVGKGTGQGLAIARSIVVDKHGGSLTFDTMCGVGTTFHLRVPVAGASKAAA
jgi:PAS domain S-box-containing protein